MFQTAGTEIRRVVDEERISQRYLDQKPTIFTSMAALNQISVALIWIRSGPKLFACWGSDPLLNFGAEICIFLTENYIGFISAQV
jgi:hypothetical protein